MKKISLFIVFSACLLTPAAAFAGQKPHRQVAREEVIVTQSGSGEELHGRLLELSSQSLAILVDGQRVDVPIDNVLRIDGTHDSLKNGTIIGASVMGGLAALTCAGYATSAGQCLTGVVINAGLGALVGAGIDALHKGRSPIYIKPAKSGSELQVRIRF
jgi:hypothetical protein